MKSLIILLPCWLLTFIVSAQIKSAINVTGNLETTRGRIYDAYTKEPVPGATILTAEKEIISGIDGSFIIPVATDSIEISAGSYFTIKIKLSTSNHSIALFRKDSPLEEVVVSANRDMVKRTQAPIAISMINARTIQETKATTVDQLVNKVSGVYMVNLGNEQHSMGIRQPMGTRSLFLYLEDGIPVRTSGVFNHNALMEMNMAAVSSIEVIKGPGSSLYGGEAIGGAINMITSSPTAIPLLKISAQLNTVGYRRADIQTGFSKGRWGFNMSGYYASRNNGFIEFTDFHKAIGTARIDYRFNSHTRLENSITYMDYYSDMSGGVDSTMFAKKSFTSQQTFTYRKARTIRYRSSLIQEWNSDAKTTLHAVYRDNSLGQNPSYRVRDDYRRTGAGFTGNKELAHGEINDNSFNSYVFIAQHRQHFKWLNTTVVGGASIDISPNTSIANYIRIRKDTLTNKYNSYTNRADSLLVDYRTGINNTALFSNIEISPLKNWRVVASLRYDRFRYAFNNNLPVSSVSGSADTVNHFSKLSPKIGLTYNAGNKAGFYVNYSVGFVPPQVSELYRAIKVPTLDPSTFINYETGGWAAIIPEKLSADISLYQLEGKNSIISVRFDDGTFGNANAGGTLHRGIELGINATPVRAVRVRLSGAYSKHEFTSYTEREIKYDGNEMNNAPRWLHNAEIAWNPLFLKGFRASLEWQKMSSYYMDQTNLFKYEGFDVFNARLGYQYKEAEIWLNIINLFDSYYAVNSSRSSFGRSYTPGEPLNINLGMSYNLGAVLAAKRR